MPTAGQSVDVSSTAGPLEQRQEESISFKSTGSCGMRHIHAREQKPLKGMVNSTSWTLKECGEEVLLYVSPWSCVGLDLEER